MFKTAKKGKGKASDDDDSGVKVKPLDPSLVPITNIESIFHHLVKGVQHDLKRTVTKLGGRKLRIATMCRYASFLLGSSHMSFVMILVDMVTRLKG